jgi:hypothetical protein
LNFSPSATSFRSGVRETAGGRHADLLAAAGSEIPASPTECRWRRCETLTWIFGNRAERADAGQLEARQAAIVGCHLAFALQHVNRLNDWLSTLVVISLFSWDRGVAGMSW